MKEFDAIKLNLGRLINDRLVALFDNPNRFMDHSIQLGDLLFDYSKNYITKELLNLFVEWANKKHFKQQVQDMFAGANINFTEQRAVLHAALRDPELTSVVVGGNDYYQEIWGTYYNYTTFAENIRNGSIKGYHQHRITDIINIGIGGSYLPLLASYRALTEYCGSNIRLHFVSNVDGTAIKQVVNQVNPKNTLFVITSKTFTTSETMLNATSALQWVKSTLGEEAVPYHFVAVTTNTAAARAFGITDERIFTFWDFVGGRYSLWSSVALPLVIAIGKNNFEQLLQGARFVDRHFKEADLTVNIPFIMAVISMIYRNFLDTNAEAVIPYCDYLDKFPLYLQQIVMESNGKNTNRLGQPTTLKTSPVVFGEVGTNAQHSFFQMLHQGSDIIPVDFIGVVQSNANLAHQEVLVANLIAQSEALMVGKTKEQVIAEIMQDASLSQVDLSVVPHKLFAGNRPSNTLLFKQLTPHTLGMLYALYEYKVYCLGIMWDINSFDQYGVELGKELSKDVLNSIRNNQEGDHTSSTNGLIRYYKQNQSI